MGDDVWRDENEWPLARAQTTSYYLHSGGNANTLHGDGSLSPGAPGDEAPDVFLYNPANPVPTRGGQLCCNPYFATSGAFDQNEIEQRSDVLVYSTPTLERGRRGNRADHRNPVGRHLRRRYRLHRQAGGCLRGRLRPQPDRRHHPGPVPRLDVRPVPWWSPAVPTATPSTCGPPATCSRQATVSDWKCPSSNFPRFDRNTNTGGVIAEDTELKPAVQTILHDAAHPSHVSLPIVPR